MTPYLIYRPLWNDAIHRKKLRRTLWGGLFLGYTRSLARPNPAKVLERLLTCIIYDLRTACNELLSTIIHCFADSTCKAGSR